MVDSSLVVIIFVLICYHTSCCNAFKTISTSPKAVLGLRCTKSHRYQILPPLFVTNNDDNEDVVILSSSSSIPTKRKRKRKKKKQGVVDEKEVTRPEEVELSSSIQSYQTAVVIVSDPITTPPVPIKLEPREDAPVQMEMKNIRDLAGGGGENNESNTGSIDTTTGSTLTSMFSSIIGGTDANSSAGINVKDGASFSDENRISNNDMDDDIISSRSRALDDSLDQLLEDARRMTAEEGEDSNSSGGGVFSDEEGPGIKSVVGNALSTIVTADFFFVCGFLVWFLLGIFCSSILKDDTVQIAFNNNFERLVQPALGVLMIASVGGSFFNKEEEVQ